MQNLKEQVTVGFVGPKQSGKTSLLRKLLYTSSHPEYVAQNVVHNAFRDHDGCCTPKDYNKLVSGESTNQYGLFSIYKFRQDSEERNTEIDLSFFDVPSASWKCFNKGLFLSDVVIFVVGVQEEMSSDGGGSWEKLLRATLTYGWRQLVIVINKMDLVDFSQEAYLKKKMEILKIIREFNFLDRLNIGMESDGEIDGVYFIPTSGLLDENIVTRSSVQLNSWYDSFTLSEFLKNHIRSGICVWKHFPLRVCILHSIKISGVGTVLLGRVVSGSVNCRDVSFFPTIPHSNYVEFYSFEIHQGYYENVYAGDCIGIATRYASYRDFSQGNVMGHRSIETPKSTLSFEANIIVMEHNKLSTNVKYSFHCHTLNCEVSIKKICELMDVKTRKSLSCSTQPIYEIAKSSSQQMARVIIETRIPIVVERFKDYPSMGRFIIGNFIAFGIITKVYSGGEIETPIMKIIRRDILSDIKLLTTFD